MFPLVQGFDLATKPAQFFISSVVSPWRSPASISYCLPSYTVSGETSISLATFEMG